MTDLKLDPDSLSLIVQKAILDSLTDENRDAILAEAVRKLLTVPKENRYGQPTKLTPLQEAFTTAVDIAAQQLVRDMVANDEALQAKLVELVSEPIAELAKGNWDGLPERIGQGVAEWLRDRSRS